MKKILLPVFLLSLFFFSCKKDSQHVVPVNSGTKKYAVQFNLSGFQQIIIGASEKNHSLTAKKAGSVRTATTITTVLHYLVFDSNGNLLHTVIQPLDSGKAIALTDSLAAGTYTFCFAVGGSDMEIIPANKTLTYPYVTNGTGPGWEDTFTKQVTLTVGNGNLVQNITLNRLVAELEVDVTGTIPNNAASLEIKVDNEYVYGKFTGIPDTTEGAQGVSYRYATFPMTTTTTQFDLILLNTVTPFNVDLTAYDASGSLLAEAKVSNVKCSVNTRTILTGALFGSQSQTFTISLNDQWVTVPYQTINF